MFVPVGSTNFVVRTLASGSRVNHKTRLELRVKVPSSESKGLHEDKQLCIYDRNMPKDPSLTKGVGGTCPMLPPWDV